MSGAGRVPPRLVAAAWFGGWGLVTTGAMFLESALGHGWDTVVLYVLCPGLAATVGGAVVGRRLLAGGEGGVARGVGLGVLAVILAHLLFAPLFAGGYWAADWLAGRPGHVHPAGLTLATLAAQLLMFAPLTLGLGAVAGGLLAFLRRRMSPPTVRGSSSERDR